MIRQLTDKDELVEIRGQHYVISECDGCHRHVCTGRTIASVNWTARTWDGQDRSQQYEFRYDIDREADAKGHPGVDVSDYCHFDWEAYRARQQ